MTEKFIEMIKVIRNQENPEKTIDEINVKFKKECEKNT